MGRILFITGTGTDVGKTALSLAALLWARGKGLRAAYLKPVQCGTFAFGEPAAHGGDADWIRALSGGMPAAVTCALRMAASPHLAAEREGRVLDPGALARDARAKAADCELLILEGSGGAAVPLNRAGSTVAEVAKDLGAPALIACAPGLGTLHHTLATVAYLRGLQAPIAGFAFCEREAMVSELAADNAATLRALTTLPYFGMLPFQSRVAAGLPLASVAEAAWIAPLSPALETWWSA